MERILTEIFKDAEGLAKISVGVVSIVFVLIRWHSRQWSATAAVGALILAGVVNWGIHNMTFLESETKEYIEEQNVEAGG